MRGERTFRAGAALLACPAFMLAAFSVLRVIAAPGRAAAAAQPPAILAIAEESRPSRGAGEALVEAARAAEAGDLARADAECRLAWRDPAMRARAATALQ